MPTSLPPRSVAVLIPAGGRGNRFGGPRNKIFEIIAGKPVWFHAVERFAVRDDVGQIVIALSEPDQELFRQQCGKFPVRGTVHITTGGDERVDSVRLALDCVTDTDTQLIAVHDAARPFVPHSDLDAVFAAANETGAAMLAAPLAGSLKRDLNRNASNVDRRDLHVALTPQVFKLDVIRDAYSRHRGYPVTDDAQLVQQSGHAVRLVPGNPANLKITYPDDLAIASAILKAHAHH